MPSSVVALIRYDPDHQILTVVFQSGRVYHYKDVPEEVYVAFRKARSKGKYLNEHIKEHYEFEPVES